MRSKGLYYLQKAVLEVRAPNLEISVCRLDEEGQSIKVQNTIDDKEERGRF